MRAVEADAVDGRVCAFAGPGQVRTARRDGEHTAARANDRVAVAPGAGMQDVRIRSVLCGHLVEALDGVAGARGGGVVVGGDDHGDGRVVAPAQVREVGEGALRGGQEYTRERGLQAGQDDLGLGVVAATWVSGD